jgi:TIR domain
VYVRSLSVGIKIKEITYFGKGRLLLMTSPLEVFCCYAREDQDMLRHLKKHLAPLVRGGQITIWSDINLNAGVEWEKELHQHLESADIILLLISPDFMDSDYCYSIEMGRAITRHKAGSAQVIPVLLRPTFWRNALFAKLQMVPRDAKPVASWLDRDDAFHDVTVQVDQVVSKLQTQQTQLDVPWLDDVPVIGDLSPETAATRPRQVGEDEVEALEAARKTSSHIFSPGKQWWKFSDRPWVHTAHAFGYLPPAQVGNTSMAIQSAENIPADPTLKNARVTIALDRLRIASYPGRGIHHILVHFYAQNQISEKTEDLHFSAAYRVREEEHAALRGYPVFVGLQVGNEGIRLGVRTINVKNNQDEALLTLLGSDGFKKGLHLTTTVQPALVPLSEIALGLARMLLTHQNNISVQDIILDLDFSTLLTRPHLAEGSYLAIQIPQSLISVWDWEKWVYHPVSGLVVKRDDHQQTLPYNYLVFSIRRYEDS